MPLLPQSNLKPNLLKFDKNEITQIWLIFPLLILLLPDEGMRIKQGQLFINEVTRMAALSIEF